MIYDIFDMVYYINMDKDVERNKHTLALFAEYDITKFKRMKGMVINTIPAPFSYRNFNHKNKQYVLGALGCRASHLNIIQDAQKNNYKKILIFEDDVDFNSDPNKLIEGNLLNLKEFDLVYFGGQQEQHFNNQIVQTHAMGISHEVFEDIWYLACASGMEIDNFYAKILQQMSVNNRVGGRYITKKIEPFNTIYQSDKFKSNIK
jgi:GR25 family glycosyltransferase involved in LPS biosynthesis